MKRVSFAGKPSRPPTPEAIDDWVLGRAPSGQEPTKRFTIDVPVSLHKRVKSQCALQNLVMADVMRELLAQRFPEERETTEAGEVAVNTTSRKHDDTTTRFVVPTTDRT